MTQTRNNGENPDMDAKFWLDRWQQGEIGFHRDVVHEALIRHCSKLGLASGSTVFVPLCGKTHDMIWLANQGHKVIGVELSNLAVDAFFTEQNLSPTTTKQQGFTIKSAGSIELWCGDIFAMPQVRLKDCDAVYDRASLVAFPPGDQTRYVEFLANSLRDKTKLLIVSLNYDPKEMDGPPYPVPASRIEQLFCETFHIEVLEQASVIDKNENLKKRGLSWVEETTYLLSRG